MSDLGRMSNIFPQKMHTAEAWQMEQKAPTQPKNAFQANEWIDQYQAYQLEFSFIQNQ